MINELDYEHCVVFLDKRLYSHSASVHPGEQTGTSEFNAGVTPGNRNTVSRFTLQRNSSSY